MRDFLRGIFTPRLAVDQCRDEGLDVLAGLHEQLAGFNAHADAVRPKALTAHAFVHLRIDVERRKERVEGRSGRVHHEGVVEALMRAVAALALDVAVLLVDLRGLRETGLLLMHGLRHEDARIFRSEIEKQRRAVLHHRDELFIAHPGRVKEDVVAEVTNAVDDLTSVIDRAVVCAELDDRKAERTLGFCFFRTHFADHVAQVVLFEAVFINTADETVGIAGRFKINGSGAGLQQGTVVIGFVIVAVKEHQIARCKQSVEHNLVGG